MNCTTYYRDFSIKKLNQPAYRHLWWLLFWPLYWLRYPLIEILNPATTYQVIHSPLDDLIPFNEWFIIPYALWMVSMLAMCVYTLLYDIEAFKRYSKFLTISMSISSIIFLIFPSCQELRPAEFPRSNPAAWVVSMLYQVDTNTNVFPSEHAIGAIAVWVSALHTPGLRSPIKTALITISMILVCLSTVFLKQHSILDVIAAVPVCVLAYLLCYRRKTRS